MNWPKVRIDELGEVRLGRQRAPQHHQGEHMRPYLRVANVFEDRIDLSDVMEMNFTPEEAAIYELRDGDVLLNEGQSLELVGRPAVYRDELPGVCFTNALIRFRPGPRITSRYALRLFQHCMYAGEFQKVATITTNIAHLGATRFGAIEVQVPPVEVQQRVAEALDKADAIRRKRREALALTDDLLRATFLEMFGDPITNPQGWPVEDLGPHLSITPGWSANGDARPARAGEHGVLKISAVTSGVFRPEENKAVDDAELASRTLVKARRGDLLFSRANTRELVAAVCLVEQDYPDLFLPDKLWRIMPASNRVTNEYLRYLLEHPRVHDYIAATATGSSGSMLNVSQDKLRAVKVPLPPTDLQERFARAVWGAYALRARHRDCVDVAENLFASLQQRAFHGEI